MIIEAVDDAGAGGVTDARDVGETMQEAVHERSARMTGTGVHHQARRLAHHDDVVVGEPDIDGNRLGPRKLRRGRLGQQLDDLTGFETVALGNGPATDEDVAVVDQACHLGAAPARERCQPAVEPLSRQGRGNRELAHRFLL
jgi:hypothetical protein